MPVAAQNDVSTNPLSQAIAWSQDLMERTLQMWSAVYQPFFAGRSGGPETATEELRALREEADEAQQRAVAAETTVRRLKVELKEAEAVRDAALKAQAATDRTATQAVAAREKAE